MGNLSEGIEERGIERGIEKGAAAERLNIVIAMLKKKTDYSFISEITQLSVEKIKEIAKQNNFI